MFRKAERKKAKARIAIAGASGGGKTYSSLLVASGLGKKIALIDTENGSGELYSSLLDYDVCIIKSPFEVSKYVDAIKQAEKSGYDVIIIDSLSHAWSGEGGLLDKQGKIADRDGNGYTAWRLVTPDHNKLVETMLQSPCHVIATMRSKQDYILELNSKGKQAPKKVGLAPIQREGMEYEFTVFFNMDMKHNATTSKDRTSLFDGKIFVPSKETGDTIYKWLNEGAEVVLSETDKLVIKISECESVDSLKDFFTATLTPEQQKMTELIEAKNKRYKELEG